MINKITELPVGEHIEHLRISTRNISTIKSLLVDAEKEHIKRFSSLVKKTKKDLNIILKNNKEILKLLNMKNLLFTEAGYEAEFKEVALLEKILSSALEVLFSKKRLVVELKMNDLAERIRYINLTEIFKNLGFCIEIGFKKTIYTYIVIKKQ